MSPINRILILAGALMACYSSASAFFLNWGASDTSPAYPHYYYQQRVLQGPSPYAPVTEPSQGQPFGVPVPSIPIQVPLQAKLAPSATVQNVQLVPCLCPISQDYEIEKGPQENNVFYTSQSQPKS